MKKVTLFDVAERAGVSPAAVSRYLNKSGYVSAEKGELIRSAMEELGYYPAQPPRNKGFICLISANAPQNSFYQMMWSAFISEAQKLDKSILILTDDYVNNETLPALVEKARRISPEGLILSGFLDDEVAPENVALLKAFGAPVVFFERTGSCREFNTVTFDESQAIESAVEYLQKLGHQKIAYIGMFHNYDVENARLEGYKRACLRLGLAYDEKLVQLSSSYTQESGRAAMQKLLADHPGLTAVITTSDLLAAGALQALNENGLSVPEDLSVVGHDDAHAKFFSPPLTSIHYPMAQAVHTALSIVIQQNGQHGSCPTIATQLGLTLTYRESARRI